MLERGCSDTRAVLDAVHAASDADLMAFGLRAYHINLLSLFGQTWSQEKIATTARAAAISKMLGGWEYHHDYLPSLTATPDSPRVSGCPLGVIKETLDRGRGLVIMTFHLGQMRYLPSDLAHAGIPICVPLARDAFADYSAARRANSDAALWNAFTFVNVEENGGTLALARVLAKGGCVFSAIDGNTGLDGPRGDQRRTTVRVLDATARVKAGLFGMAARFGSPILVMIASTQDGERRCQSAPLVDPGHPLAQDERDQWVEQAAQAAYSFFGAALIDHADEWCGGDLFHQWRVPLVIPRRDMSNVEQALGRTLGAGGRVTIDHRRVVELSDHGNLIWSDVVRGRCYTLPPQMADLSRQLSTRGGVDAGWLDQRAAAERSQLWAMLCQLASLDLIKTMEVAGRHECGPKRADVFPEIARFSMHGTSDGGIPSASTVWNAPRPESFLTP